MTELIKMTIPDFCAGDFASNAGLKPSRKGALITFIFTGDLIAFTEGPFAVALESKADDAFFELGLNELLYQNFEWGTRINTSHEQI